MQKDRNNILHRNDVLNIFLTILKNIKFQTFLNRNHGINITFVLHLKFSTQIFCISILRKSHQKTFTSMNVAFIWHWKEIERKNSNLARAKKYIYMLRTRCKFVKVIICTGFFFFTSYKDFWHIPLCTWWYSLLCFFSYLKTWNEDIWVVKSLFVIYSLCQNHTNKKISCVFIMFS